MKIIDGYDAELKLLNNNAKVLDKYITSNFDMSNADISGKYYHTFRVANFSITLAHYVGLDTELSYNIGLLHDFARFRQIEKTNTFKDTVVFDHAVESVNMLFTEGYIKQFDIPKNQYDYIALAINNHNKKEIDYGAVKVTADLNKHDYDEMIKYCKLIRDADKMDLFYRISNCDLNIMYKNDGYTESCLNEVLNHTYVNIEECKTKLDRLFSFVGFLYDINMEASIKLLNIPYYLECIDKKYGAKLNKEDKIVLKNVLNDTKEYFGNIVSNL